MRITSPSRRSFLLAAVTTTLLTLLTPTPTHAQASPTTLRRHTQTQTKPKQAPPKSEIPITDPLPPLPPPPAITTTTKAGTRTPPENLYKQQRVEYTFPDPVSLAALENENGGWKKAYAAFPCLDCYVTDAGCYYEYKQQRNTQIAFLTGDQYKALLASCASPGVATEACWKAAALDGVKVEDYAYKTYAYHDKGPDPVLDGTYLVFNNDAGGPAEIEYGMAYFGLNPGAPTEPGGKVVGAEGPGVKTRLKEIVQGLQKPVTIPKQQKGTNTQTTKVAPFGAGGGNPGDAATTPAAAGVGPALSPNGVVNVQAQPQTNTNTNKEEEEGWTRHALAFGNEVANNGYNWWANVGATYTGGQLKASFLSGDLYRTLTEACPTTTDEGLLIITSTCWDKIKNTYIDPQPLASGGRVERVYVGEGAANEGGTCVDGWWVLVNASDEDTVVTKADGNFGLRTLGNNPRDK